jgi:hypothetical protein
LYSSPARTGSRINERGVIVGKSLSASQGFDFFSKVLIIPVRCSFEDCSDSQANNCGNHSKKATTFRLIKQANTTQIQALLAINGRTVFLGQESRKLAQKQNLTKGKKVLE